MNLLFKEDICSDETLMDWKISIRTIFRHEEKAVVYFLKKYWKLRKYCYIYLNELLISWSPRR